MVKLRNARIVGIDPIVHTEKSFAFADTDTLDLHLDTLMLARRLLSRGAGAVRRVAGDVACRPHGQAGTLLPVVSCEVSAMNLHRLKAFAAAAAFLAAAPCTYGDTGNPESAECVGSTESTECLEASDSGTNWEEVKREGGEAVGALKDAAGDAVKELWSATKERSEGAVDAARDATGEAVGAARDATGEAVEAARETTGGAVEAARDATGDTLDKVREGTAAAVDSTRRGAEHVWQETREGSKRLLEAAKPKAAEVVDHAAQEGKEVLDAAREKGSELWRKLAGEEGDEAADTGSE